jgi:hypothetical protein
MVFLSSTRTCEALRFFFSIRYCRAVNMLVDLCLFFIVLVGWNEDVIEEKESPDDE